MSKSVKINGVTYENVPKVSIPLSAGEVRLPFGILLVRLQLQGTY